MPAYYESFVLSPGTRNRDTTLKKIKPSFHETYISLRNLHLSEYQFENERHSVMSDSLWPHGLYSPWNSPGQNTGVGSLSLLQGIYPTQGSNPGLLHCRWILHQLSLKRSPRILEWVAYPFSRGSSQTRNWTGVCIAGGFFTSWAMREAPKYQFNVYYINCFYVESKLNVKMISMIIILSRRLYIYKNHCAWNHDL